MTFLARLGRGALLVAAAWALSGCLPSAQSQLDEEKEPHFLAGKGLVNAMDYRGAIESFERALEANPQSASAHFELAWLFDQKEADPAAAIYHYESYLRLRPGAENAEIVRQHIVACKQELARTVSLGPVTEKVQRELEQLTEENKRLGDLNKQLSDEVAKWRAYYASRPAAVTNQAVGLTAGRAALTSGPGPISPAVGVSSNSPAPPVAPGRTHTVKTGETLSLIAREYGVRLETLMAANPKLDPRRLRVGQALSIPSP
jgi:tetratricopeptide (TPR) repeat protein